jgi:hypothetical protein
LGPEILKILTKVEGDVNAGKGVKLALWLAPSTSKPKTTVKYCEESERCYIHTGPDKIVNISEELELTLTYNRPALAYTNSQGGGGTLKFILNIWTTAKFTAF